MQTLCVVNQFYRKYKLEVISLKLWFSKCGPGSAAAATGNLLEMQILRPQPQPQFGGGASNLAFN